MEASDLRPLAPAAGASFRIGPARARHAARHGHDPLTGAEEPLGRREPGTARHA